MDRDYGKDIDELRKQIDELKSIFQEKLSDSREDRQEKDLKKAHPGKGTHQGEIMSILEKELCNYVDRNGTTGAVTYLGVFASGGRQSKWISQIVNTDGLLRLIENNSVAAVLNCIGNADRLNILLALLRTPMSVASLVEKCGFGSTGQVYHHLRPLLSADIVYEDEYVRGEYAIRPHRVQGLIMILAGIADLLDTRYSQGTWDYTDVT